MFTSFTRAAHLLLDCPQDTLQCALFASSRDDPVLNFTFHSFTAHKKAANPFISGSPLKLLLYDVDHVIYSPTIHGRTDLLSRSDLYKSHARNVEVV